MKNSWALFVSFLLLAASVGGSFYFLEKKGFFNLSHIEIQFENGFAELEPHLEKKVRAQLSGLKGRSLWKLSPSTLASRIHENDWLKSFQVKKSWPDRMRVSMVVKGVAFFLLLEDGSMKTVFSDASLSQTLPIHLLPRRPMARDSWFVSDRKLRAEAVRLLQSLPEEGVLSLASVSDISWSAFDGFSLQLMTQSTKVLIGEKNYEKKINRVQQVLKYLISKKQTGRVIDAAYSQKVLVRLRNGP